MCNAHVDFTQQICTQNFKLLNEKYRIIEKEVYSIEIVAFEEMRASTM